jgi:peptide/nickel transport system permease protein
MSRGRWFFRRVAQLLLVSLGVVIIVFFLIHLLPGDPARAVLGIAATPAAIAELHREWGLDEPIPKQLLLFLGRLGRGDLGDSLLYGQPVTQVMWERLGPTVWLLVGATLMSILIAVPLGVLAAVKRDSVTDHVTRVVPLVGFAMPPAWVGIVLILLLSLRLRVFPVGGFGEGVFGHARSMFLPALTAALIMAPILIRSVRASMIDALDSDYVDTARSKGISEWRVVTRHALRNALISSVTVMGVNIGILLGTTVVIERVFAAPGIGALLVDGALSRDFPVVQGVTLVLALAVVVVYLLTDLALVLLDPRVVTQ